MKALNTMTFVSNAIETLTGYKAAINRRRDLRGREEPGAADDGLHRLSPSRLTGHKKACKY